MASASRTEGSCRPDFAVLLPGFDRAVSAKRGPAPTRRYSEVNGMALNELRKVGAGLPRNRPDVEERQSW